MGLWVGISRLVYIINMNKIGYTVVLKVKVFWGVWIEFYIYIYE